MAPACDLELGLDQVNARDLLLAVKSLGCLPFVLYAPDMFLYVISFPHLCGQTRTNATMAARMIHGWVPVSRLAGCDKRYPGPTGAVSFALAGNTDSTYAQPGLSFLLKLTCKRGWASCCTTPTSER